MRHMSRRHNNNHSNNKVSGNSSTVTEISSTSSTTASCSSGRTSNNNSRQRGGNHTPATIAASASSSAAAASANHHTTAKNRISSNNNTSSSSNSSNWMFSWRRLRSCLLQPYQPANSSRSRRLTPTQQQQQQHPQHQNDVVSSDEDDFSTHPATALVPPPPPPPPSCPSVEEAPSCSASEDDAVTGLVADLKLTDPYSPAPPPQQDEDEITDDESRNIPVEDGKTFQFLEGRSSSTLRVDLADCDEEDEESLTELESLETSVETTTRGDMRISPPETLPKVTAATVPIANDVPPPLSTSRPGMVRRTVTAAPTLPQLSSAPSSLQTASVDKEPIISVPPAASTDNSSTGGFALSSIRPSAIRRGCSAPLAGTAALPASCPTSPKNPSPDSASSSLARHLPPKAPSGAAAGGVGASGRPQMVSRRMSSQTGPRPRLGSTHSNNTTGSKHRRQNNSFEFSVDSLQMITDPDAEVTDKGGGGAAAAAATSGSRQCSETSWSTMPMASIQFGVLQRECSELVSDEWEVDSLIMSSDEEKEEEDDNDDDNNNTLDDDSTTKSANDKETTMSPSPTSVLDDMGGKKVASSSSSSSPPAHTHVEGTLPDWMLQWAQQPNTPDRVASNAATTRGPRPTTPILVEEEEEDTEPVYLPDGPKPEGCSYSAYMAVSLPRPNDPLSSTSSVQKGGSCPNHDDDRSNADIQLVQVMSHRLVIGEGMWEIPLTRDTRIQSQSMEDDPRRVVLVQHQNQECKLFPLALIPTRSGTFQRPPSKKGSSHNQKDGAGDTDETLNLSDWSINLALEDDSQQCEAVLHMVFLLDAMCRQQP